MRLLAGCAPCQSLRELRRRRAGPGWGGIRPVGIRHPVP